MNKRAALQDMPVTCEDGGKMLAGEKTRQKKERP
jgi:hypothetical protein